MCSFSRKVNLNKGESYGGQLGRSGLSGGGINSKHLQKHHIPERLSARLMAGNLVSQVSEKEQDKIRAITDRIRAESVSSNSSSTQIATKPEDFYPDFSYVPQTYENRGKPLNASFSRKPKTQDSENKDSTIQYAMLGIFLALILVIAGLSQLGSFGQFKDNLEMNSGAMDGSPEIRRNFYDF